MIPRFLKVAVLLTFGVFIFCEWMIYYIVIYQCSWPELTQDGQRLGSEPLKALFLTDTHLLGPQDGHWFDKLRREWQMERSFQTAISIFNPDVVFVLGDLFDEGDKCGAQEFERYVKRFHKMFRHPPTMKFHVVIGNHDIGFHDIASNHEDRLERFTKAFNIQSAELIKIKGNVFVIVNSIGLEGDGCSMCSTAVSEIKQIANKINCNQPNIFRNNNQRGTKFKQAQECEVPLNTSSTILIQHFPLYRKSDISCSGVDGPDPHEKKMHNYPGLQVVSQEATTFLLKLFKPRLVLSGHSHYACYHVHNDGTPELTIPSFSWRNRNNPSFILASITTKKFVLSKCFIPQESTVIVIYALAGVILIFMTVLFWATLSKSSWQRLSRRFRRTFIICMK